LKKLLRLLVVILLILMSSTPVLAAEVVDVSITAIPIFTHGILFLNILYVSDTRMDLSWDYNPAEIQKVMVRSSYNGYPADITDPNTAPSDGNLVYYGNLKTFSDSSMNFDQNPGPIYYKAWAQKINGTWEIVTSSGLKESVELLFIGFIALAGLLTWFAFRWHNILMTLVAMLGWMGPGVWIFMGGNASLNISSSYTIFILFIFVAMAFVPLILFISRVGKTEIAINKDGKMYKLWDKTPRAVPLTDLDRQAEYRKSFRTRIDNAAVARQRRPRKRNSGGTR
jgi:hypothetical protein